ncbi:hypothetical protein SYJ56_04975 [Algoriphagus sp. D3-2-R+10]|nr:hypothetical protein [Algoriphagus sp. D3-2-R+10]MEB2774647.1 hypothetical protein [Algoriphagus sp. D3-2-R+10]
MDIPVLDHLIMTAEGYYSIADEVELLASKILIIL